MPRGTTLRNVRVSDDLWQAARSVAVERDENLSDVIRDALAAYAAQGK